MGLLRFILLVLACPKGFGVPEDSRGVYFSDWSFIIKSFIISLMDDCDLLKTLVTSQEPL